MYINLCCVCHKLLSIQFDWRALIRLRLINLSHGYCPVCYQEAYRHARLAAVKAKLGLR